MGPEIFPRRILRILVLFMGLPAGYQSQYNHSVMLSSQVMTHSLASAQQSHHHGWYYQWHYGRQQTRNRESLNSI